MTTSQMHSEREQRAVDLLLDTHACLSWAHDPGELAAAAGALIADPSNSVWISAASAWELAIKVRAGKLSLDVRALMIELTRNGFGVLGIGIDDAVSAGSLDWAHRDPFDRIIAVQAMRGPYWLVTRDAELRDFVGALTIAA